MKIQILSTLNTIFDMKIQKNKNISKIRYLMLGNMQVKTKIYILYLLKNIFTLYCFINSQIRNIYIEEQKTYKS